MVSPMSEGTVVALFILSIVGSIAVPILVLLTWDSLSKKLKMRKEEKRLGRRKMIGTLRIEIANEKGTILEIFELVPFTKKGNVSSAGKRALEAMVESSKKGYSTAVSFKEGGSYK